MNQAETSSTKPKVAIVSSTEGDWEGIYIDGVMKRENHRLSANLVLFLLAELGVIEFEDYECDADWLDQAGASLPENFSDVEVL